MRDNNGYSGAGTVISSPLTPLMADAERLNTASSSGAITSRTTGTPPWRVDDPAGLIQSYDAPCEPEKPGYRRVVAP